MLFVFRSNSWKSNRATRKISTKSNPKSRSSRSRNPVPKLGLGGRSSKKALQQKNKVSNWKIGFQQTGSHSCTQHRRISSEKGISKGNVLVHILPNSKCLCYLGTMTFLGIFFMNPTISFYYIKKIPKFFWFRIIFSYGTPWHVYVM